MSLTTTTARLVALAGALPGCEVPSHDWDARLGLPRGTTADRTGIDRRFRCAPGEDAFTLGRTAIVRLLAATTRTPAEIDLVIDCSSSSQQPLPGNAACLLEQLGPDWAGVPGIDVRNTCLGFLAGLHVAQALVAQTARRIIVVSAETPYRGLRHDDAESAPLFGEGAAAALVERGTTPRPYYYAMQTFAAHRTACQVLGGGHRLAPFDHRPDNDHLYRFAMDGPRLHKIASRHLPPLVQAFRAAWPDPNALWWIPHPASGPAVELMRRRLRLPPERFFSTIREHGNLVSAGIPYQLAQARAAGCARDFVAVGTAAGYSQAILAWGSSDAP